MSPLLENTMKYWPNVAEVLSVPRSEAEYQRAVALFDELKNRVGEQKNHLLADLVETISVLIAAYKNTPVETEEERRLRGQRLAEILQKIADTGGPNIDDPVAWQREIRRDRPLPGRET